MMSRLLGMTFFLFFGYFLLSSSALNAEVKLLTLSSYTTSIEDQDYNVKANIALAANKLNGAVIRPNEVFSFNSVVGDGSAANGFLIGRVLYQDTAAYEPGGGICQVSSTLFNAMLLSGFPIIERHRHSNPVRYVPLGLDATIRYGKKDLRMKNPTSNHLYIYTSMNDRSLTIMINGAIKPLHSFEIYTEEEEINLPFKEEENQKVRPGFSVYVYRKKLLDGKVIENLLLYKDFYPPVNVVR
jgi:vancomycin resistance protein YoaR